MDIRDYRLSSMDEPSDEFLHEIMEQVAESARQSSSNANRVLRERMAETIALIKSNRQTSMA